MFYKLKSNKFEIELIHELIQNPLNLNRFKPNSFESWFVNRFQWTKKDLIYQNTAFPDANYVFGDFHLPYSFFGNHKCSFDIFFFLTKALWKFFSCMATTLIQSITNISFFSKFTNYMEILLIKKYIWILNPEFKFLIFIKFKWIWIWI